MAPFFGGDHFRRQPVLRSKQRQRSRGGEELHGRRGHISGRRLVPYRAAPLPTSRTRPLKASLTPFRLTWLMSFVTLAAAGFAVGIASASTGFSSAGVGLAELALGVPGPAVTLWTRRRQAALDKRRRSPLEYRPVASRPVRAHDPNAPVMTPTVRPGHHDQGHEGHQHPAETQLTTLPFMPVMLQIVVPPDRRRRAHLKERSPPS